MPPSTIGPYRIVRLLGEGGMGAVYEALHETIERRVALKVLLPEYAHHRDVVTRFFNEARAVNRIEHPSLVQVSDFGHAEDGTAYMVMEYLHGETLTARLDTHSNAGEQLPLFTALQISEQIAAALTAAHDKGIVHRDLKPGNVMLVPDPAVSGGERAKILDFGIAKLTQGQGKGTNTNALMGTPRYMSPEQCRGAGEVDHKTDVYALGVMLYEMLTGRLPFLGEGAGDFIGQHMFKEPPPIRQSAPRVPSDVAVLVHRLLVKDRAERPTMREVRAGIAKLLPRFPPPATSHPSEGTDPDATRRFPKSASPSTLGELQGQTLRSPRVQARRNRIAVMGGIIVCMSIAGLYRFVFHPTLRASVPVPESIQSPKIVVTPLQPAHSPSTSAAERRTDSATKMGGATPPPATGKSVEVSPRATRVEANAPSVAPIKSAQQTPSIARLPKATVSAKPITPLVTKPATPPKLKSSIAPTTKIEHED